MVEKPPAITAWISEWVMSARYGRMSSGASVCPTKIFPATLSVSVGVVPNETWRSQEILRMSHCMTPR